MVRIIKEEIQMIFLDILELLRCQNYERMLPIVNEEIQMMFLDYFILFEADYLLIF